ncbi:hypothetical protein KIH39_05245 [Telmatocola sphagniphila]|uniref:PAS domain-containing protein n=1 Tax=Telmatocola sphagniphila TaxID=1123043 RepID=A0A8E6B8Y7_9BACT|nr:hypothetical protein [Telmatocola sphagniphila]QVL33321.1 hypothetical protein KIH39_05245 [Telmatocola sphagniphila]
MFSVRIGFLAAIPLLTALLWFVLPADLRSEKGIFLTSGLASILILACGLFLTRTVETFRTWVQNDVLNVPEKKRDPLFGPAKLRYLDLVRDRDQALQERQVVLDAVDSHLIALNLLMGVKQSAARGLDSLPGSLTELRNLLQTLRSRMQVNQSLLQGIPVPVVVTDDQGRLLSMNQLGEKCLALNPGNMAARNIDEFLVMPNGKASALARSEVHTDLAELSLSGQKKPIRFFHGKVPHPERKNLSCWVITDRSQELAEKDSMVSNAAKEARLSTLQQLIRDNLVAELPLAETLQAKCRLALGEVKQSADKSQLISRIGGIRQDLDQWMGRLRLWESLYRVEWTELDSLDLNEITAEEVLQDSIRSLSSLTSAKRVTIQVANKGAGWLCADSSGLFNALRGLLEFAIRASSGERVEVRVDKLPGTAELSEGWVVYEVLGEWKKDWLPAIADGEFDWESLLVEQPGREALLGYLVAARVSRTLNGFLRAEESPDGRRIFGLYVPTRLPEQKVVQAGLEIGPIEELCLGWKLGMAV